MNNQDPNVSIEKYPDNERIKMNKEISIAHFISERLDNFFNIFLSISGLYHAFRSTSPASIYNQYFSESFKKFSNSFSSIPTVIFGSSNFLLTVSL